jgi:hypothetical protein
MLEFLSMLERRKTIVYRLPRLSATNLEKNNKIRSNLSFDRLTLTMKSRAAAPIGRCTSCSLGIAG